MENVASSQTRVLTAEEVEKLKKQNETVVSEFKKNKLEMEARKNWDLFYKRNETRFFRDRHWTTREFEQLAEIGRDSSTLLEVGCGVGNFLFPLLEENPNLSIYACDFSARAVQMVKEDERFNSQRLTAFTCDVTTERLAENVPPGTVDLASLIFVLSAIHPDHFVGVLRNISEVLKCGGFLIFRDYGLHDMAQIRFGRGNKIADNFYVRQDGTRSYFFSVEFMEKVAVDAGLHVVSCHYVHRRTVNKKEGVDEPRVFVQAKFSKV